MWICPKCETRNDTEKCVICGEMRPACMHTQQRQTWQQPPVAPAGAPPYRERGETAAPTIQNRSLLLILTCVLAALVLAVVLCILAVVMTNEKKEDTAGVYPNVISETAAPADEGILPDDTQETETEESAKPETAVSSKPTVTAKTTPTPKPSAKATPKATPTLSPAAAKDKLRQFAEHDFTDVRMQTDAFTPIYACHSFARQTQKVLKYTLMDLNGDGKVEAIISSEITGGESEESVGYGCFSIWTVDKTGDIKCVMAKAGWPSRFAYSYSVISHNGTYLLLESAGAGSSTGSARYRNTYTFTGETIIQKNTYTYEENEGVYHCSIDGKTADARAVLDKIEDIDGNAAKIIEQAFPEN